MPCLNKRARRCLTESTAHQPIAVHFCSSSVSYSCSPLFSVSSLCLTTMTTIDPPSGVSAAPLLQPASTASTATSSSTTAAPATGTHSHRTFRFAHPFVYFFVIAGMTCLGLAAFLPSLPRWLSPLQPIVRLAYYLFAEQWVVQGVFCTAVGLHVGETLWVCASGVLDRKGVVERRDRMAWVVQTALLGWGSVGLLRQLPNVRPSPSRGMPTTATAPRS